VNCGLKILSKCKKKMNIDVISSIFYYCDIENKLLLQKLVPCIHTVYRKLVPKFDFFLKRNPPFGRRVSCLVGSGDLIHKSYLQINLPPLVGSQRRPGIVDFEFTFDPVT
jgi:hypothetical protein